jgi:hypothetical protein
VKGKIGHEQAHSASNILMARGFGQQKALGLRMQLANPGLHMGFDGLPWDFERQWNLGRPRRFGSSPLSNVI